VKEILRNSWELLKPRERKMALGKPQLKSISEGKRGLGERDYHNAAMDARKFLAIIYLTK
jgi:hypothetical protein